MSVIATAVEDAIRDLGAGSADPVAGLFGPQSAVWSVARHNAVMLGGGRAALLQLAHPAVAWAISDHSDVKVDPLGRFNRTFSNVYDMIFGDLHTAVTAARRVHTIHTHIVGEIGEQVGRFQSGDAYRANDPAALLWVYGTLMQGAVQGVELVGRPLEPAQLEAFWRDSKRFAGLFGLTEADLPERWTDFERYMEQTMASNLLGVGEPATAIATALLSARSRTLSPFFRWYRAITAGLLPERFRRAYGLAWGRREQAVFAASVRALKSSYPLLPGRVRDAPAYTEARRRMRGGPARDRVGRALESVVLGLLLPAGCPVTGAAAARSQEPA
jgi:uncharacterized protein (DUF2236 family)